VGTKPAQQIVSGDLLSLRFLKVFASAVLVVGWFSGPQAPELKRYIA
jgi:hypothetical protein